MQAATETLYIPGRSPLHRLHPFNKLAYILLTGVSVYLLPGGWLIGSALVTLNCAGAAGCGLFQASAGFLWRTLLPLALFMLPIHGSLHPDNQTSAVCFFEICLYREGLMFALDMILKVAALLAASLLFVFSTHPADLIAAVTRAAGSPALGYLIGSPLLLLPSVRRRVVAIQSAQQARGMDIRGSLFKRIRGMVPLVMPLVLGALMEIEQRSIALELKGFKSKGPRTALRQVPDSMAQKRARQAMLALTAGILLFKVTGI